MGAVVHPWSEDARDLDPDVDVGVVPDHGRVDDESEECDLVSGIVLLEKGGRIVITDRGISWTLSYCCAQQGEEVEEESEMHRESYGVELLCGKAKMWERASDVDTWKQTCLTEVKLLCAEEARSESPRQLLRECSAFQSMSWCLVPVSPVKNAD